MANHRARTPVAVRESGRVLAFQHAPATTLFDLNSGGEIHPDFEARAAIWRDQRNGVISIAEAQRRSALVGQVKPASLPEHRRRNVTAPSRYARPAPQPSRQYAPEMATTAARDDRLVPNAKALLQVLRARAGKGTSTITTKFTLASIMSRSARTIARYLRDLERFGYVSTEIRSNSRGLHLGLVVTILGKVMPFFNDEKGLAAWLAGTPAAIDMAFDNVLSAIGRVTGSPPKNQPHRFPLIEKRNAAKNPREGRNPIPI
ncbi:MAG: helix-turn-helix domain-containing protein [Alphaproteobacteria bacterium]|nr:MAG: helix-turn-helix domain-containing protein [Alphaproteobacteria bacterium]